MYLVHGFTYTSHQPCSTLPYPPLKRQLSSFVPFYATTTDGCTGCGLCVVCLDYAECLPVDCASNTAQQCLAACGQCLGCLDTPDAPVCADCTACLPCLPVAQCAEDIEVRHQGRHCRVLLQPGLRYAIPLLTSHPPLQSALASHLHTHHYARTNARKRIYAHTCTHAHNTCSLFLLNLSHAGHSFNFYCCYSLAIYHLAPTSPVAG